MILLSPSFLFFLTLVQFVTSSPTDNGTPLTVPLRRRERPTGTFMDVAKMADNMRVKYGYDPVLKTTLQRRQKTTSVSIQDEGPDVSYFAAVEVGTPPQTFNVILDTGSSDFWVASTACQQGCQGSQLYDFQSSSTFKDQGSTVQVQYGSGSVIGELGSETISLGGFTIQNQGFIVAQAVSAGLVDAGSSGLIGLAFETLAQTGATPAVQALAQNNQLSSPEMGFFLARNINNPNVNDINPGGTLTLGGTNSSLFTGSIQFIDFPSGSTPSFWLIPVDAVSIGGKTISVSQQESAAAIDTGTTLIGVPSDTFNEICSQIPNSQNGTGQFGGFCIIPCSSTINSAMTFGGKSWPINPADFSIQQPGNNGQTVCVGAMFDLTPNTGPTPGGPPQKRQNNIQNPTYIVGDTFLKNVYTVFRFTPPSVGFAQLSSNGGGSGSTSSTTPLTSQNSSPFGVTVSSPSLTPTLSSTVSGATPSTDSPLSSSGSSPSNTNNAISSHPRIALLGAAFAATLILIRVIGEENVPEDGPIIVLFANPVVSWILTDTGNIPVDRRSKDNQVLFKGTFDCLAKGEVVALFPEGTSYTEPRIMQVKDGASWSALEFAKWAREHKTHKKPLIIIPAGIVYTEKAKYRSRVIVEFAKPILLDEYAEEFMSDEPGKNKSAVKQLTSRIEEELERITINAPDWETLYCARITRDMLWQGNKSISLDDYVLVSQTLIDLFSTPMLTSSYGSLRKALLTYYSLLQSTNLTNSTLSRLPLPDALNPSQATPLPSRLSTLLILLSDTFGLIIRIPLFLLPFLIHAPALVAARHGANIAQEEETEAQNKVVFALLLLLCIYPSIFLFLWVLFRMSSTGAAIALVMTYALIVHYHRIVDSSYEQAKRLVAAWRVLLGVWMPKKWDLSISALTPYITPHVPPPSEFIDKKKIKSGTNTPSQDVSEPTSPLLVSAKRPKRRVPTRQLIRHVLRARLEASRLLAMFFADLERSRKQVRASNYLTALYGTSSPIQGGSGDDESLPQGYRDAREVIGFLRDHGANIGQLRTPVGGDWAAASSDGDESFDHGSTDDDLVWVT